MNTKNIISTFKAEAIVDVLWKSLSETERLVYLASTENFIEAAGYNENIAAKHEGPLKARMQEDNSITEHKAAIDKHPGQDHEKLVHHMATFDPTPNKKYLPWMAKTYANKGINKIEDMHRTGNALKLFHKYNSKLDPKDRDINAHKTLPDLEDKVSKFNAAANPDEVSKKDLTQHYLDSGQATKIHDSPEYSVHIPHTRDASRHFGVNTKWCTTAKNDDENMFDNYNKKGKLFYINHKPTNTKHALLMHHNSDAKHEMYNSQDDSINPSTTLKKMPEVHKAIMNHVAKHMPSLATTHALNSKKRWPEAEPAIYKNPKAAAFYSHKILKNKIPEAEGVIHSDPKASLYYKLAHGE